MEITRPETVLSAKIEGVDLRKLKADEFEIIYRTWLDHAVLLFREALQLVPSDDAEQRSALRRRLALASTASFHLDDVRRPGSPQA